MAKDKKKKKKKTVEKIAKPNKLAKLIAQRLVEGKCMKVTAPVDGDVLMVEYTLQPTDLHSEATEWGKLEGYLAGNVILAKVKIKVTDAVTGSAV